MLLSDALIKIQEKTNDYFLLLIGEWSNASLLTEPAQLAEREKYRRILASIEFSEALYQKYLPQKQQALNAQQQYQME